MGVSQGYWFLSTYIIKNSAEIVTLILFQIQNLEESQLAKLLFLHSPSVGFFCNSILFIFHCNSLIFHPFLNFPLVLKSVVLNLLAAAIVSMCLKEIFFLELLCFLRSPYAHHLRSVSFELRYCTPELSLCSSFCLHFLAPITK